MSGALNDAVMSLAYLVAAACFVLSLKWLSHPTTARRGVKTGELGMLLAVAATLVHVEIVDYRWIAAAIVAGVALGVPLGLLVPMTAVPQRTALSHAFGALAATLVGTAEFYLRRPAISATTTAASVFAPRAIVKAPAICQRSVRMARVRGMVPRGWKANSE